MHTLHSRLTEIKKPVHLSVYKDIKADRPLRIAVLPPPFPGTGGSSVEKPANVKYSTNTRLARSLVRTPNQEDIISNSQQTTWKILGSGLKKLSLGW